MRLDNNLSRGAVILAAVALAVLAAPIYGAQSFTQQMATVVDAMYLFVAGLVLVMVELFLFPGHGIAAVPGMGLIVWSAYITVTKLGLEPGMTMVAVEMTAGTIVTLIAFKFFPMTPAARMLFHNKSLAGAVRQQADQLDEMHWGGRRGAAVSDLRPSGSARFDDRVLDVVSEDGYLEKGAEVEISRFEDGRVLVKSCKTTQA